MAWFYMQGSTRVGPFGDADWARLLAEGKVTQQTWVWRQGMPAWLPLAQATDPPTTGPQPVFQTMCRRCGEMFTTGDVAQESAVSVCPACAQSKPAAGAGRKPSESRVVQADSWRRVLAFLLDSLSFYGLYRLIGNQFELFTFRGMNYQNIIKTMLVVFAVAFIYETVMTMAFAGTLGKLICRVRVARPDASAIGWGRAVLRSCAKVFSFVSLYLGFLIAFFDDESRTLHDRVCGTRVLPR